jgi:hypothetical protein
MHYLTRMYDTESDSILKLLSEDMPQCSESGETSLRQALIKFLDKIDYSLTTYPQFKDLELAVRNEIVSFGIDLRPGWETILRSSCALIGMGYPKHPLEIQFSIAVCNHVSCLHVVVYTR